MLLGDIIAFTAVYEQNLTTFHSYSVSTFNDGRSSICKIYLLSATENFHSCECKTCCYVSKNSFLQCMHAVMIIMFILSNAEFSNVCWCYICWWSEPEKQAWNNRCPVHKTAEWHLERKFFVGLCNRLFRHSC